LRQDGRAKRPFEETMQGKATPWDRPGPWSAPPAARRNVAGIVGALLFSLALWGFIVMAALGLILKIAG
jgi:hypothetical protein